MEPLPPPISDAEGSGPNKIYRAGTLTYTKVGLAMLLVWLFWGDFCYTVMEAVTGPIMQLKFQKLGASNEQIGWLASAIPTAVYMTLNPIISFKSDRFRSRWGRRLPFIVFSLPFLVGFLLLLASGDHIGAWVHAHLGSSLFKNASPNQVIIYTYAVILVVFTFFNTFVTSTFWYLFNDVVPEHLLARFMSWFRTVSLLSTSFYQFFIFPHSQSHAAEIFIGASVLYLVGFGLMCTNVKEGQYPPPAPFVGEKKGVISGVVTFLKETHWHGHYWWQWMSALIGSIGGTITFTLFFQEAIGLSLLDIGIINGIMQLTIGVMTIGAGWLADRYHPLRIVLIGGAIGLFIMGPINLMWIFWHPVPLVAFWVYLLTNLIFSAPAQALGGMGDPPMLMRMFPRSNYGQFCATNALWRSLGGIIGSVVGGKYLDFVSARVGHTQAYCYMPLWSLFFGIPAFFCLYRYYRSWKKYGGDEGYVAPILATANPLGTSGVTPVVPGSGN